MICLFTSFDSEHLGIEAGGINFAFRPLRPHPLLVSGYTVFIMISTQPGEGLNEHNTYFVH